MPTIQRLPVAIFVRCIRGYWYGLVVEQVDPLRPQPHRTSYRSRGYHSPQQARDDAESFCCSYRVCIVSVDCPEIP